MPGTALRCIIIIGAGKNCLYIVQSFLVALDGYGAEHSTQFLKWAWYSAPGFEAALNTSRLINAVELFMAYLDPVMFASTSMLKMSGNLDSSSSTLLLRAPQTINALRRRPQKIAMSSSKVIAIGADHDDKTTAMSSSIDISAGANDEQKDITSRACDNHKDTMMPSSNDPSAIATKGNGSISPSELTFTLFPRLPIELRLKIWHEALSLFPRIIELSNPTLGFGDDERREMIQPWTVTLN
ncbi:uncharacterized protein PAC_01455 [Phialocephala subalpina]|uniref:2EXR domain-containing protein n=1 Tax=Phialocephala subalpina TaxID=576137 RepID=A0A1L7WFN8_9HELO|nr:uncharacterized protein PAC_01455 [Phialocephala subalpina]